MKDRKRAKRRTQHGAGSRSEEGDGDRLIRHYGRLAAVCVGVAAVIVFVVAYLTPTDNSPPRPPDTKSLQDTPTIELPSTAGTIELPSTAVEVTAEELRKELLQVGADLLAWFPEVPEALHVVAMLYADIQMTTEAERIWRGCIELAPKQAGPYIGLAKAAMELGKDEMAVETLRQAFAAGCSSPDTYHQLAAALTKLGRLEEAEGVIQEGLAAFPQSSENWLQLGQVQIQLGRFAEAETSLQKAIAIGTTAENVYFLLATACARQGKLEEAAKYRREFSERKAERAPTADTRFQARYDAELRRIAVAFTCRAGTVYDRQGHPAQAERLLVRALFLAPEDTIVCGELATFYRRRGRIADAQLVQRRLVEIEPQNVLHLVNLASLSSQLGDNRLAETALKQVIAMRPDVSIGYSGLAQLYLQTGDIEKARWFAEAALRQQSTSPEETVRTYLVLVAACRQMGDNASAEAALGVARKLAPDDPRVSQTDVESP